MEETGRTVEATSTATDHTINAADLTVATDRTITAEVREEIDYKALYEQTKAENDRLRASNTKASADVSKFKKQLSEVLSKEELAKREAEEEQARKDELLKQYIERDRIRTYSDKYQGAGFSKEYADKMASLLPEGVADEYFDNLKASNADTMARLKAEALNNQPKPTNGTPPTPKDLGKSEEDKLLDQMLIGAGLIK